MTAEQFIGEYLGVYGRMPGRLALQTELSLTQRDAVAALKAYTAAHPDARRSTGGVPFGTKLSKSDRPDAPKLAPRTEWQQTGESATIECRESATIRTLEDLLDAAQVDSELWSVSQHVINKWDVIVRNGDDNAVTQMWQVKATLKRRSEVADLRRIEQSVLDRIASHAPTYGPITRPPNTGGHLLLLSPSDAHLGKLSWEGETGETYNLQTAVDMVRDSIRALTADALHHGLERICLVIGNDFTQSDSSTGTTTKGTYVDNSDRYWKVFQTARDLLIGEIEWLTQYAPVTVITVPANHDYQTALHMAELLAAWFKNCPDVSIEASPKPRKYFRHGSVLLGFTHGNEERHASLPQIMAAEQRHDWAQTTCREWITGHYHRKGERNFMPLIEDGGVTIRTMPSLSKADSWHHRKGYLAEAAGQAVVYHSESGLKAQYFFKPPSADL